MSVYDYRTIRIDDLYNNKGISWVTPRIPGSINHIGESIPGELLPLDQIKLVNGIPFKFPKTNTETYDMISCEAQTIPLAPIKLKKIIFLGLSTWGDYEDFLEVFYTDGFSEEVAFGFNEWLSIQNQHNRDESGLILDYYRFNYENINRQIRLSVRSIDLNSERFVERITLPDNVFTYIIAITLGY